MSEISKVEVNGVEYDVKDQYSRDTKANSSDVYLKTETYHKNEVYNKNEVDTSVGNESTSRQQAIDDLEERKAEINGYYDELTAGSAEQLLSSQFVEDSVPYKFRTSGGSADIGNREYDEIVGGSIVWNQVVKKVTGYYPATSEVTVTFNEGHTIIKGTPSADVLFTLDPITVNGLANHVYLYLCNGWQPNGNWKWGRAGFNNYAKSAQLSRHTANFALNPKIQLYAGTTYDIDLIFSIFDLTQMFGSTVADYIYSLETAQSGKGVAFFKSLFPNDYYPYNAGELMSVEGLQSHDMVGFNQWDEEWELGYINPTTGDYSPRSDRICSKNYIPVLPNTAYYFEDPSPTYMTAVWYDENQARIRNNSPHNEVITSPSNARYLRFSMPSEYGTTYKNDICINLSWSGWRNGEYEPYKKHSYALDSSLTLRGITKLNAQNELYFDGDIYSHDGKVQRRYGVVDLGSLNWGDADFAGSPVFRTADLQGIAKDYGDGVCTKLFITKTYATVRDVNGVMRINDGYWSSSSPYTVVHDETYADASAFKTAMSGVMLIYELATPTEETATPFDEIQLVDDFGTEEYVSGNLVPVGHNTKYPANLRDKLQHLPDLGSSDGFYLIRQSGTQMSLEAFHIPKAPTTDGTYTLKATVSNGTPTYTWEAVE